MVNYKQFYQLLSKIKVISPIWEYILDLIEKSGTSTDGKNPITQPATMSSAPFILLKEYSLSAMIPAISPIINDK